MRRLYSIFLTAALLLPFLAPLLSTAAAAQPGLAACCRRTGEHHCMGGMALATDTSLSPRLHSLYQRCPYQQRAVAAAHHELSTLTPAAAATTSPLRQLLLLTRAATRRLTASDRSHQKRGPPALLS